MLVGGGGMSVEEGRGGKEGRRRDYATVLQTYAW